MHIHIVTRRRLDGSDYSFADPARNTQQQQQGQSTLLGAASPWHTREPHVLGMTPTNKRSANGLRSEDSRAFSVWLAG